MDLGVEVELESPDSFLLVKETLTRIGICSLTSKTLYQSCHLLHKQGKYYVIHFKELFKLDKRHSDISVDDIERRDTIVRMLRDWGLVKVIGQFNQNCNSKVKVIPFKEKGKWTLTAKYTIGSDKRKHNAVDIRL